MTISESILKDYIIAHGTQDDKEIYSLYEGNVFQIFGRTSNLEEAMEFGSIGVGILIASLVFVLQSVAQSIIQDGYDITKKRVLSFLKKDQQKIIAQKSDINEELIKQLIGLLEKQLEEKATE